VAAPKVVVRWDSAAPLRDVAARTGAPADVKNIADWSKEFYVVTVSDSPVRGLEVEATRKRSIPSAPSA